MAGLTAALSADLTVVRNGVPVAAIVDGGTPEGCLSAADELQKYVMQITGSTLPTAAAREAGRPNIIVGGDAAFQALGATPGDLGLGRDGFVIRTIDGDLVLAGARNIATLYAVYDLLEDDIGCHWFWPGDIGEVVPRAATITLPDLDRIERPGFSIRWVGSGDWALRNRMSVNTNQPDGFNVKWFVHTYLRLVPPEEYWPEHPEYYAEAGGERLDPMSDRLVNVCTSNPEVAEAAARTIDRVMAESPGTDMISVDPEDTQQFCRCAACEARYHDLELPSELRNSLRVFEFTNAVADLVRDRHPDLTIKTIAYHSYVRPPADPTWRPRDNVAIQFCRFMCHNHALADPSCPDNRGFDGWYREWLGRTSNVMLYEYYWKVSWLGLPWPINRMLHADIPRFGTEGLLGVATQHNTNYATNGLGYWLAAKLLWDPKADVDALIRTYYEAFFAETSQPVAQYYEELDRAAESSGIHIAGQRPYADILTLFTPELIADLAGHLTDAAGAANTDDVVARVRMLRAGVDYTELVRGYLTTIGEAFQAETDDPWAAADTAAIEGVTTAAEPKAQAIRDFLALPENAAALDQPNSYTNIMLKPANVVGYLHGGVEGEVALTKPRWLEREGVMHDAGPRPETFAIWVYGNDLDFVDEQPEHDVLLRGPDGEWESVGGVGNTVRSGDGATMCFVVGGVDAGRYLRGSNVEIRFANKPGGPFASRVFAMYVMPNEPALAPDVATQRIANDLNAVRATSAGFTEYGARGFMSRDEDQPWDVPLEFLGFPQ